MKLILMASLTLLLAGCASRAVQTEAFFEHPNTLAVSKEIANVPFVEQSAGHCGPATLTMAMNWAGYSADVNQVAPLVYTPGMKGSLQTDMLSASRRLGLMAVQIEGLRPLLTEVNAGHPVIVFENLALTWAPQWHYALVYGYDLEKKVILMHSGPEKAKRWDMAKFERSWMLGDYWGLVILPPGQLAAAGDELAHVTAAAGLEQSQKIPEAKLSYSAILQRWPQSLGALIGLANIAYQAKDFKASARWLEQATTHHPQSAAAWHNRAFAEGALNHKAEADHSARQALALVSDNLKQVYTASLAKWLKANAR